MLYVAASKGDVEVVHHLIDAKVDLDAQDMVRKMDHLKIVPEILKQNLMMLEWVDVEYKYPHKLWVKLADYALNRCPYKHC